MNNYLDKKQLLQVLTVHLEAKLAAQLRESEELVAQASESNRKFFVDLQQSRSQSIQRQLKAFQAYAPKLESLYQTIEPGALVQVSSKQIFIKVAGSSTPAETYQSLTKKVLARRFDEVSPQLAYWWLLPEVAIQAGQQRIDFEWQRYQIMVVSGALFGYEISSIIGLQVGDRIFGSDFSGYYEDRQGSTYPNIVIYQTQILAVM